MNGRKKRIVLVICAFILMLVGCCSTNVIKDDVGEPLTAALITGSEITATTEVITTLVESLPDSPIKNNLDTESKKLSGQVKLLNEQLSGAVKGYWELVAQRSAEQSDLYETKILAANRLTWAITASCILVLVLIFFVKKIIPF